jgi:hypothetical protein
MEVKYFILPMNKQDLEEELTVLVDFYLGSCFKLVFNEELFLEKETVYGQSVGLFWVMLVVCGSLFCFKLFYSSAKLSLTLGQNF